LESRPSAAILWRLPGNIDRFNAHPPAGVVANKPPGQNRVSSRIAAALEAELIAAE
jgi:hypothetical protein